MSSVVFPSLPGLAWDFTRTPVWSTTTKKSVSGRSFRAANMSYPLYRVRLVYEVLRQYGAFSEMATLVGFFNARQGGFDSFLWSDPDDNAVTAQAIGVGDGSTVQAFQLVRTFGGYVEPVFDPILPVALKLNGSPCNLVWNGGMEAQISNIPNGFTGYSSVAGTFTGPAGLGSKAYGFRASAASGAGTLGMAGSGTIVAGGVTGGVRGGWVPGATYTIRFYARKINGAGLSTVSFGWNVSPLVQNITSNPSLSTSWQGYEANITWGASVEPSGNFFFAFGGVIAINDEILIDDLTITNGLNPGYDADQSFTQSYTVGANGLVWFDGVISPGYPVTWIGSYYRRMAFVQDTAEFVKTMSGLWGLKSVEMESVKP